MKISDINHVENLFQGPLINAFGNRERAASIEFLEEPKEVEDDTLKLMIRDSSSRPTAVLLCSSDVSPQLVARGMDNASYAKTKLGNDLGSVILDPIGRGEIQGKTYTILPYRMPISDRRFLHYLQVKRLAPDIFRWLRRVTKKTSEPVVPERLGKDFIKPLKYLLDLEDIDREIRDQSLGAIKNLESGNWGPKYVLMHGDLWKDNFLFQENHSGQNNEFRFVLIDWPGCLEKGYAIYDLVRLCISFGIKKRLFNSELRYHCEILECSTEDAMGYLLAALGNIGLSIDHFPYDKYIQLVRKCYFYIKSSSSKQK